jgi:uncharacterized membrane protein
MTNDTSTPEITPEITSDDKLWGALSYFALIAIIVLVTEEKKKRPFIKFHAMQSIALSIVLIIASIILGLIPFIQCITPFLWLILFWPAIDAYRGNYTQIPLVTDFIKKQGWV